MKLWNKFITNNCIMFGGNSLYLKVTIFINQLKEVFCYQHPMHSSVTDIISFLKMSTKLQKCVTKHLKYIKHMFIGIVKNV